MLKSLRIARTYWDTLKQREALPAADTSLYRRLSPNDINQYTTPPTNAKMLSKTFIHDALYNPYYGYFAKNVSILSPLADIPFNTLKSTFAFSKTVGDIYTQMEEQADTELPQIWHTPTELFKPWYGHAIADYLLRQYDANPNNYPRFLIYELGAGNGTLMQNIMDYLGKCRPEVYAIAEYVIIEISSKLAVKQNASLAASIKSHEDRVRIVRMSILDWDIVEELPCFVLAMEVIDNLAHDLIRYDFATNTCFQAVVSVDESGDYQEEYEVASDPDIIDFLAVQKEIGAYNPLLEADGSSKKSLLSIISPFSANMTEPMFIPTNTFRLFRILKQFFPRHSLCLTDFSSLPDTVEGINAPVVQTRLKGNMVPCSTYLVQPGWFDIFFPTDFESLKQTYDHVMSNSSTDSRIMTHRAFLKEHSSHLAATETKNGDNPLLDYFANVSFLLTNKNKQQFAAIASLALAQPPIASVLSNDSSLLSLLSISTNSTVLYEAPDLPSCAICLDPILTPFHYFNCSHTEYHGACIYEYRSMQSEVHCPLCRQPANPSMPNQAMFLALDHIFSNNTESYMQIRNLYVLSDVQSIMFATLSLQSSIYVDVLESVQLRTWRAVKTLFQLVFIAKTPLNVVDAAVFRMKRRLVIGMGTLSITHVKAHAVCIISNLWDCSSDFLDFYARSTPNAFIDLTDIAAKLVYMEASVDQLEKFLQLPDVYLPDALIGYMLRIAIDSKRWALVDRLITLATKRTKTYMQIFKIALGKLSMMPQYLKTIVKFHAVVAYNNGGLTDNDDYNSVDAHLNVDLI